jgi:hypothetical protein
MRRHVSAHSGKDGNTLRSPRRGLVGVSGRTPATRLGRWLSEDLSSCGTLGSDPVPSESEGPFPDAPGGDEKRSRCRFRRRNLRFRPASPGETRLFLGRHAPGGTPARRPLLPVVPGAAAGQAGGTRRLRRRIHRALALVPGMQGAFLHLPGLAAGTGARCRPLERPHGAGRPLRTS